MFGLENRLVTALEFYHLDFTRPAAANFPFDQITLVDPFRGYYGLLTTQRQTTTIDSFAINLEDRLKPTQDFALIVSNLRQYARHLPGAQLTDRRYATWSDPSYPDQIFPGAPRTCEIETFFKF